MSENIPHSTGQRSNPSTGPRITYQLNDVQFTPQRWNRNRTLSTLDSIIIHPHPSIYEPTLGLDFDDDEMSIFTQPVVAVMTQPNNVEDEILTFRQEEIEQTFEPTVGFGQRQTINIPRSHFVQSRANLIVQIPPIDIVQNIIGGTSAWSRGEWLHRNWFRRFNPNSTSIYNPPKIHYIHCIENPLDESCPICMTNYNEEDTCVATIGCSHIFHKSCLDEWINKNKNTCPLCRECFERDNTMEELD